MDYFHFSDGQLWAEELPLVELAKIYGTPTYVYSRATLERHWHAFNDAFGDHPHLICYAVKANSNLAVLNVLARMGSGFDVVSVGELERVLAAGGKPDRVVFSGVGKQTHELQRALEVGIHCFNVESLAELIQLNALAEHVSKRAPVSLRINPDVDAKTHPYISTGLKENKFGIDIEQARTIYRRADEFPHVQFIGVDCHIGSQLTELSPFLDAMGRCLELIDECERFGLPLQHLDLGGGLGVSYHDEVPPLPMDQAKAIKEKLDGRSLKIILEPGRAIAANAGILLTRVILLKENNGKHFAIVDAAMNDLLRPALYNAWQSILPVRPRDDGIDAFFDVVGPVCETGDFLGKDRHMNLLAHDLIAIRGAGAYGFSMSSNYNTRPRAAEVMVDGRHHTLARDREKISDLYRNEHIMPEKEN